MRGPGKPCVNMAQGGNLEQIFSFGSVHSGPHIFISVWLMSGATNCAPAYWYFLVSRSRIKLLFFTSEKNFFKVPYLAKLGGGII